MAQRKRTPADGPSAAVRMRVMKRDRFRCTYCGVPGTDAEMEVDHIIPVSKGGSNHMSNLTTACRACNSKKSDRLDFTATARPKEALDTDTMFLGMFLHTVTEDGEINLQGKVVAQTGSLLVVQLFSWLDGRPTNIVTVPISETSHGGSVRLYTTRELWLEAYEKQVQNRRKTKC